MSRRIRDFFTFTRAQMRGVLWLLPLMAAVAALIVFANRPRFEKSFLEQVAEQESGQPEVPRYTERPARADSVPRDVARAEVVLSEFDPNALDVSGFVALGFSRRQSEAIIRYREARGGFRTADDLGRSYVVSDEMFARLRPYIRVEAPAESVVPAAPTHEEFVRPEPEKVRELVELNTADSAALIGVSGIGNVLVVRIMEYRERLGGYARAEQLREIPGMSEENFLRILPQISVDSCEIQKIDVNFASPRDLGRHPYVTPEGLRKLLKNRQLKGGWRSTGELVEENILTPEQAERLGPYLVFN